MFLYDTSIMKIKAGGLGGFLSYTEKKPNKTINDRENLDSVLLWGKNLEVVP